MLEQFSSAETFLKFVSQEKCNIDCLVIETCVDPIYIFNQLEQQEALLPGLLLESSSDLQSEPNSFDKDIESMDISSHVNDRKTAYYASVLTIKADQINQIGLFINQAIGKFLELAPACLLPAVEDDAQMAADLGVHNTTVFISHQKRLAEKLKERLGYLGVYYRRNSQNFLRNMQSSEKQEFLAQLKSVYREIILSYFLEGTALNPMIDNYVNMAFFADIPIARVVEIHMELMDEFSKQLKLEGRSEEILLEYRLTLIDTLANLCEMYRRSIPRDP